MRAKLLVIGLLGVCAVALAAPGPILISSGWDSAGDYTTTGSMSVKELDITPACTIAADDTTPSVAGCSVLVTSANTGATAITDLDLPTVGQIVTICGGSATNSSTIADSGNFNLDVTFGGFTAYTDNCLTLYVQADNDYVEVSRSYNYTTVSAINGGRITATGGVKAEGSTAATGVLLGSGAPGVIGYILAQTPDSTVMAPTANSNSWLVCEVADVDTGYDFAHPLQTNPTVFIHSANQSKTEWVSLTHNQTDAVISSGAGNVLIQPTGSLEVAPLAVTTDAAPATSVIASQPISTIPGATNVTGAALVLAPSPGERTLEGLTRANTTGDTLTFIIYSNDTSTTVIKTEGDGTGGTWDGDGAASDAEAVCNLYTLLTGAGSISGVTVTRSSADCSDEKLTFTVTPGVAHGLKVTSSDDTNLDMTSGTDGATLTRRTIVLRDGGTNGATIGYADSAAITYLYSSAGYSIRATYLDLDGADGGVSTRISMANRLSIAPGDADGYARVATNANTGAGAWVNYPQTINCADNATGDPSTCGGAQTISSNVVIVNCADASGGCTLTLAETNYSATVTGNVIFHAGATQTTQLTLADSSGVVELAGGVSWTPAAMDTLCLSYSPALYWAECGRSDNTP